MLCCSAHVLLCMSELQAGILNAVMMLFSYELGMSSPPHAAMHLCTLTNACSICL